MESNTPSFVGEAYTAMMRDQAETIISAINKSLEDKFYLQDPTYKLLTEDGHLCLEFSAFDIIRATRTNEEDARLGPVSLHLYIYTYVRDYFGQKGWGAQFNINRGDITLYVEINENLK